MRRSEACKTTPHGRHELLRRDRLWGRNVRPRRGGAAGAARIPGAGRRRRARAGGVRRGRDVALASAGAAAAARRSADGARLQGAGLRGGDQATRARHAVRTPGGREAAPRPRAGPGRLREGALARVWRDGADAGRSDRAAGRARPASGADPGDRDDAPPGRLLGATGAWSAGVAAAARRARRPRTAGDRPSVPRDGRRSGCAHHCPRAERRRVGHRGARLRAGAPWAARARRRAGRAAGAAAAADRDLWRRAAPAARADRGGHAPRPCRRPAGEPARRKDRLQWLLWAGSSASLRATLGPSAPPVPPRARPAALRVGGYRYALSLLVGPQAVPAGTPSRLLAIGDPARPLVEDNAIAVTVGRPGPREPDRIPLWIECAVPAHLVDAGPSYLRALRGRLLQTLERFWPGLAKNILIVASPYDGLGAQRAGDDAAADGKIAKASSTTVAVVPPPLYSRAAAGPFDVTGLPHGTGVKNLLLVGRENLPGLGLEGELVSGWGAARLVGHAPVRRVSLRRRTLLGS